MPTDPQASTTIRSTAAAAQHAPAQHRQLALHPRRRLVRLLHRHRPEGNDKERNQERKLAGETGRGRERERKRAREEGVTGGQRERALSSLSGSSLARFQEGGQEEEKGVTAGKERERGRYTAATTF
jgi:hypothetical protein